MLFNSLTFLIFIALFAGRNFATHGRARLWVICISSYVLYGLWDWRFMGLLFAMTAICWYCALRLATARDMRHRHHCLNLGDSVTAPKQYTDSAHLNRKGATEFAEILARVLKHNDVIK